MMRSSNREAIYDSRSAMTSHTVSVTDPRCIRGGSGLMSPPLSPVRSKILMRSRDQEDSRILELMDRKLLLKVIIDPLGLHRLIVYLQARGDADLLFFYLQSEQLDKCLTQLKKNTEEIYAMYLSSTASMYGKVSAGDRTVSNARTQGLLDLENPYLLLREKAFESIYQKHFAAFLKYRLALLSSHRQTSQAGNLSRGAYTSNGLTDIGDSFCLSDATPGLDFPVTMASDGFVGVTGFERHHVIDRNCRFLQGSKTSQASIVRIRNALVECRELVELILNYKYDGKPFWNLLILSPLKNAQGQTRFYLGCQIDVTASVMAEKKLEFLIFDDADIDRDSLDYKRSFASSDDLASSHSSKSIPSDIQSASTSLEADGPKRSAIDRILQKAKSHGNLRNAAEGMSIVGAEAHLLNVNLSIDQQAERLHGMYSRFFIIDGAKHVILYRSMKLDSKPAASVLRSEVDVQEDAVLSAARVLPQGAHLPSVFSQFNSRIMTDSLNRALSLGKNLSLANVGFDKRSRSRRAMPTPTAGSSAQYVHSTTMHITALRDRDGTIGAWILILA